LFVSREIKMQRQTFVKFAITSVLAMLAFSAHCQDAGSFPSKPIRIIVNFPPGGTVDVITRSVAQKLTEKWGQPVVIDNRPGAGGNIGAQAVAMAEPDGYTLLATPPGPMTINQYLYKDMRFEPAKLSSVIMMASVPNAIAARIDFPANNVKELIAYTKANPGKVNFGSQGNGSTSHLTGQMFASMVGSDMMHIPFKGEGPALTEILGGRVDLFLGNISAVLKLYQNKQIKLLGVASPKRSQMASEVPSSQEFGMPDFVASAWFAIAAPPGTPAPIVAKLNAAISDSLKLPDIQQKMAALGGEVVGGSPADMTALVIAERARWKKVIETANVKLD
jgi:tripartite-type tricarboxylate transporter receptor subunit TctC